MCLAVPMEVLRVDGTTATVRAGGVEISAALDLVENVRPGDYVLVHTGYAIQVLEAGEARETLAILEKLEGSWRG